MTIYDNWVGFSGVYRVCPTTVDVWSSNWESSWEWGTFAWLHFGKGKPLISIGCAHLYVVLYVVFLHVVFPIDWSKKKHRKNRLFGTHWDDHGPYFPHSNSWPRMFGFILKTKPRTFEIRTQLGLRLETFWSQFFVNKNTFEIHIYYSHLLSFILIYYHLLFASVLCDNIPLGSFVVLFGILDCQSGFSFVPLDAA